MLEAMLYEHEDGRRAVSFVVPAPFTHGNPKWHRVGPVQVHAATQAPAPAPEREGARDAFEVWAPTVHMRTERWTVNPELYDDENAISAWQGWEAGAAWAMAGYKLLEDGKTMIPDGWTPLRLEWEPCYPEDVAFGPQRMMNRLKKWLDRHFAAIQAPAVQAENDHAEFEVWEGDELFASTSGPRAQAWVELMRYAAQCEGVVRLFEVSRVECADADSHVPVQGSQP